MSIKKPSVGLLGGTFNPVHIGHVRLALEVCELLQLERVELIPCAVPPHKTPFGLLPFEQRAAMLHLAVNDLAKITVNEIEADLSFPSYTWNLIEAWKDKNKFNSIFILGDEDFATLDQWFRGRELPGMTDLVIVPRSGVDSTLFVQTIHRLWPQSDIHPLTEIADGLETLMPCITGGTHRCCFLPLPRLEISASDLRQRWLRGSNLRHLIPDTVLDFMSQYAEEIETCWRKAKNI